MTTSTARFNKAQDRYTGIKSLGRRGRDPESTYPRLVYAGDRTPSREHTEARWHVRKAKADLARDPSNAFKAQILAKVERRLREARIAVGRCA